MLVFCFSSCPPVDYGRSEMILACCCRKTGRNNFLYRYLPFCVSDGWELRNGCETDMEAFGTFMASCSKTATYPHISGGYGSDNSKGPFHASKMSATSSEQPIFE